MDGQLFEKALPISIQVFDLSAILPAVFFMFRYGHRRGKGTFLETFGPQEGTDPECVSEKQRLNGSQTCLSRKTLSSGLKNTIEKAILGDLLLCYCIDNVKNSLGRQVQVQRVAPAHYLANWVDLPDQRSRICVLSPK